MNKRLIIICGIWNKNFIKQYELLIEYCEDNLCDVIIASNKLDNELAVGTYIEVENDCIDKKIFSYKCLEYGNYEKNKIELENLKLYDVCFFVDANDFDDIEFGKEFVYPNTRQVITSNINEISKSLSGFSETKIKIIPTSFWYSKSIDFNIISQFWKGKHYKFPKNLETSKYRFLLSSNYKLGDYPKYDIAFYNFLRKLHFTVGVI